MTNVIGYRQLPDRDAFAKQYESGMTQQQLADIYGCGKKRIRQWLVAFGLPLRPRGAGNNQQYVYNKDMLLRMVDEGMTNQDIADDFDMSISNLCKILKAFDIYRDYETDDYKTYCRKVRWLTEKQYSKYKDIINPYNKLRGKHGVDGAHQVDHIVSVRDCYTRGWSIEEASAVSNLQMITWEDNLSKRTFVFGKAIRHEPIQTWSTD